MPRWVLRLLTSRPLIALARWLSRRLDALLAADFESRFVSTNTDPRRIEPLEDLVRRTFSKATALEKQHFEAWFENYAKGDQHTLAYAEVIFAGQRAWITENKGPLAGLRILELGPGHSVVPGLFLYAHGAARYVGADYFPIAGRSSELYRRARQHLAETAPRDVLARFDEAVSLAGPEAVFTPGKVEWRHPVDAAKLPFEDASFDVVISNAAFEHFLDPVAAARESARVLAPGGVGIHQIDLRDHRDFEKPLDFLRYEEDEWRRLNAGMECYTNRARKGDFERAFKDAGLAVARAHTTNTVTVDATTRASFHARFREREDLDAVGAFFVVKKT